MLILSKQKHPGDPREESRGQLVHYWPKTGQAVVVSRSLDLNGLRSFGPGNPFGGAGKR